MDLSKQIQLIRDTRGTTDSVVIPVELLSKIYSIYSDGDIQKQFSVDDFIIFLNRVLEDYADAKVVDARRNEPLVSFEELEAKLRADGKI